MATNRVKTSANQRKLEDYRAYQEEMLKISREYSQARLAVWLDETRALHETWSALSQQWQGHLGQLTALAGGAFDELAARGEASAGVLAQSWQKHLADVTGAVEQWGSHFLQTLGQVAAAWGATVAGRGGGQSGWLPLLGEIPGFGGWFHQGGIVEAHQGMVVSPGSLMGDEQLILAQAGEGVLPRESMARLGEKNFEALRTGRFETAGNSRAPSYHVTIQVQALDASGVAGLDWDRLVRRHLAPALRQDAARRW